jgi:hypothetical protein
MIARLCLLLIALAALGCRADVTATDPHVDAPARANR